MATKRTTGGWERGQALGEGTWRHTEPPAADRPPRADLEPRPTVPADAPSAQTGLLPAVRLPSESVEAKDAQDASRTTAESRSQGDTEPALSAGRVALIVEDARELAELIEIALHRLALTTVIETYGALAVDRCLELRPDVILLDIGLPDMNGWQVLDAIRARLEPGIAMPAVVVITAYGDSANRFLGRYQHVQGYLVKPVTAADIVRVVTQALADRVG